MAWDPAVYGRFQTERETPFLDLLAHVPDRPYRSIVDAGCGTGRTTRMLAERYPTATVTGVDASAEMLTENDPSLRFVQADIRTWRPEAPVDLLVSNAVLHWIPKPEQTLRHLVSWLDRPGVLAVQVPANQGTPGHRIVRELADEEAWKDALDAITWGEHILSLAGYRDVLAAEGMKVDAWDTVYQHALPHPDGVLEWLLGTTLRPITAALEPERFERFLDVLRLRLRDAYPTQDGKVQYPFLRRFVVASHA